jgi:CRP/FNR family transcriptional regulator
MIGVAEMTQQYAENILRVVLPFWEHLSDDEKGDLAAVSVLQNYKPGALIHNCTDSNSPGVQIIRRGRARVFISSPDGKQLTLQRIGDNQLFAIGVSCLLNNTIFDVSLETETRCEVILIPRTACKKIFDTNAMIKSSLIDILSSRFAHTMRILEAIAFTSTKSRLANALIEHSFLAESSVINTTHASIAADLGTTREVVTRLLHQFQNDGFVTLQQREIRVDNKRALIDIRGDYLGYISDLLYPKVLAEG